jgi:hypothetical protein
MSSYSEQINRIKEKLVQAKRTDFRFTVFGAGRHQYIVNKPASVNEITAFEQKYELELPECYKAFLLQIGNGGISYADSAAGPAYGIYPLDKCADERLYEHTEKNLKNTCILEPQISEERWISLTRELENEELPDEDYDKEIVKLYGGVLPVGSQGCTYIHALILNGEHKGRIVNMDLDRQQPHFAPEKNFLDWYEAWLDQIIGHETKK